MFNLNSSHQIFFAFKFLSYCVFYTTLQAEMLEILAQGLFKAQKSLVLSWACRWTRIGSVQGMPDK